MNVAAEEAQAARSASNSRPPNFLNLHDSIYAPQRCAPVACLGKVVLIMLIPGLCETWKAHCHRSQFVCAAPLRDCTVSETQ